MYMTEGYRQLKDKNLIPSKIVHSDQLWDPFSSTTIRYQAERRIAADHKTSNDYECMKP